MYIESECVGDKMWKPLVTKRQAGPSPVEREHGPGGVLPEGWGGVARPAGGWRGQKAGPRQG